MAHVEENDTEVGGMDYEIIWIQEGGSSPKDVLEAFVRREEFGSDVLWVRSEHFDEAMKLSAMRPCGNVGTFDERWNKLWTEAGKSATWGSSLLKKTSPVKSLGCSLKDGRHIIIEAQDKCFEAEPLEGLECIAFRVRGLRAKEIETERKLVDEELHRTHPMTVGSTMRCSSFPFS